VEKVGHLLKSKIARKNPKINNKKIENEKCNFIIAKNGKIK